MKRFISAKLRALAERLLDHLPYVGDLRRQLRALQAQAGPYPPGHYYSPIPDRGEVQAYLQGAHRLRQPDEVDFRREEQGRLLEAFCSYYQELPFSEQPGKSTRYYYDQGWFSYADAIFLHCLLRHFQPRRIIEVGSGYSSAVMLDTFEFYAAEPPELTLIEPDPQRLQALLKPGDQARLQLRPEVVQRVTPDVFRQLRAGDLLFIDSSHVVKCASDVQYLLFEILPTLAPGVIVHFHDIFYPFEYPQDWLLEGKGWNEVYFLRAFLAYNTQWEVVFFAPYACATFPDLLAQEMPLCLRNPGGSLYLRRK